MTMTRPANMKMNVIFTSFLQRSGCRQCYYLLALCVQFCFNVWFR